MLGIVSWFAENWDILLVGFVVLEKVVKLSPTKYDDILIDFILKPIFYGLKGK